MAERDVRIARPDDHVDRSDRLRAVRQGRDRLRAADPVDLVDADEGSRRERGRGDTAVGVGGHAECELPDSRDLRGDRGHQDRRRVRGAPARHVQAGAVDGDGELLRRDAVVFDRGRRCGELVLVVLADAPARELEPIPQRGGRGVERGPQVVARHAQVVETTTVELLRELAQRGIAAVAYCRHDGSNRVDRAVVGREWLERAGEIGTAAEIESGEHGAVIVTVTLPGTARIARRHHGRRGWLDEPLFRLR